MKVIKCAAIDNFNRKMSPQQKMFRWLHISNFILRGYTIICYLHYTSFSFISIFLDKNVFNHDSVSKNIF